MQLFETITAIPAITVIVLLIAQIYKTATKEPLHKHIPALCGVVGAILGIVCYRWAPGYLPAENLLVAAAIGAVSGWAATGVHQTKKQETER